ncbi:MAG TPA: hypothetical protein VKA91_07170 [Nitrososphaeraceae archaeon]|nr:hypothetical protein [Nitrososphaeraceae archaeon]
MTKERVAQMDMYIQNINKLIETQTNPNTKALAEGYRSIALTMKDLYELVGASFTGIIACKEWISVVHRKTLGNASIELPIKEEESLKDRFEKVFGELEKKLKDIDKRYEENKDKIAKGGGIYG